MDWPNERWVRLYTRDTTTWKMLDWRARTVLMHLLRKVDRAGVLDVGDTGTMGLSAMLELPLEIVEPGLERLLHPRLRVVVETATAYVLPNFLDAQEAVQTTNHRSAEYRARKRDFALAAAKPAIAELVRLPPPPPARTPPSLPESVTIRDAGVTPHHDTSRATQPAQHSAANVEPTQPSVERLADLGVTSRDGAVTIRDENITPHHGTSLLSDPIQDSLSPARVIPPDASGATPPAVPHGDSAWHRRQRWWSAMLEADQRIRAAGIQPNAPKLPKSPAGENEQNMSRCERQLLDGGASFDELDAKMQHIIAVAEAEAIAKRTRRYFLPALIWDPRRAIRSADTSLADAVSLPQPLAVRRADPQPRPSRPRDRDPPPITISDAERAATAASLPEHRALLNRLTATTDPRPHRRKTAT